MINCLVIDDEPYARELLREFIQKTPSLRFEGAFSSPLKAIDVLRQKKIDVLFLDIQMPDISGIDFLKTLTQRPAVIFTTAFAEYALDGFELDATDYLLKPFDFNRFLKAVNKVTSRPEPVLSKTVTDVSEKVDFIFMKDGNKLVKLELPSILYIKGLREYVTVVTNDRKIISLQSMKSLEDTLPPYFVRIHNSYIVNLRGIDAVYKNKVQIKDTGLPIGITFKKKFFERIAEYFPGKSPMA